MSNQPVWARQLWPPKYPPNGSWPSVSNTVWMLLNTCRKRGKFVFCLLHSLKKHGLSTSHVPQEQTWLRHRHWEARVPCFYPTMNTSLSCPGLTHTGMSRGEHIGTHLLPDAFPQGHLLLPCSPFPGCRPQCRGNAQPCTGSAGRTRRAKSPPGSQSSPRATGKEGVNNNGRFRGKLPRNKEKSLSPVEKVSPLKLSFCADPERIQLKRLRNKHNLTFT